jgi:hypothetical protein
MSRALSRESDIVGRHHSIVCESWEEDIQVDRVLRAVDKCPQGIDIAVYVVEPQFSYWSKAKVEHACCSTCHQRQGRIPVTVVVPGLGACLEGTNEAGQPKISLRLIMRGKGDVLRYAGSSKISFGAENQKLSN